MSVHCTVVVGRRWWAAAKPAARGGWSSEPPNTTTSVFERPDDSTRSICRCTCAHTRGGVGVGATAGCPTVQRPSNDAAEARCPSANAREQSQEPMNRPTTNCSWASCYQHSALRARSGGLRWPQSVCTRPNVKGQGGVAVTGHMSPCDVMPECLLGALIDIMS